MEDFHTTPRLYVTQRFIVGQNLPLEPDQGHYLTNVMRLGAGDTIRLFNGQDGEHRATLNVIKKKLVVVEIAEQLRPQPTATDLPTDLWLCASPIKRAHYDMMVMKATELGVSQIHPILTTRTQIRDVNMERLRAIAIEASEQSERLDIPTIMPAITLDKYLAQWPQDRLPLVCAEFGEAFSVSEALSQTPQQKVAIFTGPEGGYQADELDKLRQLPQAKALRLGQRILRADTAALAALVCWQAFCGDWQSTAK